MAILRRFTPLRGAGVDRRGVPRRGRVASPCSGRRRRSPARIRAAIQDELRLTASVGVATTKLVAKVASDLRKPDALVVVPPGDGGRLPGAPGASSACGVSDQRTRDVLAEYGVRTIGDLAALACRHP